MDAAVAGAVLLGLCEPAMTGLGGDCFVLWSEGGTNSVKGLNASGRAPAAQDAAQLRDMGETAVPAFTAHAVTIPTAVAGFAHLAENVGKLGLDRLLAPSIHYAEAGIPVAPRVAFDWKNFDHNLQGSARDKFLVNGKPLRVGEIFRAPGQAEVLKRIAKDGADAFYKGEVAEDMVASLNAAGGLHTLEDFANARCDETTPISGTYKDIEVVEHPPNGQGATAILMLNILAQFDLAAMEPFGTERAHIEAEAAKLAYDTRNRFLSDAAHMTRLDYMMDMDLAKKLATLIDPKKAMPTAAPLTETVHKETIYITVVDRDGMVVSLIYSVFKDFGSGIASDKFGILFQNRGAAFTLEEGHPNELKGGKRPSHTIIPGILRKNGNVVMPFGVMGGPYQPNGHARFVTNIVDFGMDPQAAIDAPRSFSDAGDMQVERGYSDQVRQELADMGHAVSIPLTAIGGAQAIRIRDDGVLEGASDPRKDGAALGY